MKKLLAMLLSCLMIVTMSVTALASDGTADKTQQRLIGGACVVVIFAVLGYKASVKKKNGADKGKTISTANALKEQEEAKKAEEAQVEDVAPEEPVEAAPAEAVAEPAAVEEVPAEEKKED